MNDKWISEVIADLKEVSDQEIRDIIEAFKVEFAKFRDHTREFKVVLKQVEGKVNILQIRHAEHQAKLKMQRKK